MTEHGDSAVSAVSPGDGTETRRSGTEETETLPAVSAASPETAAENDGDSGDGACGEGSAVETQEQPKRRNGAAAATAARVLKKRRRWAGELRAAGWTVTEPEQDQDRTPRVRWIQ